MMEGKFTISSAPNARSRHNRLIRKREQSLTERVTKLVEKLAPGDGVLLTFTDNGRLMLFYEKKIEDGCYLAKLTDIYPRNIYSRSFALGEHYITIDDAPAGREVSIGYFGLGIKEVKKVFF